MKKIITSTLAVCMLLAPMALSAAPFDWKYDCRNGDDTADIPVSAPSLATFATGTMALLGSTANQDNCNSFWLVPNLSTSNGGLRIDPTGSGKYQLSVDLGGWNPLDIGNMTDLFDAKVGTTTLATALAGVSGGVSTSTFNSFVSTVNSVFDEINANLYGTSTTMTVDSATTTSGLLKKADKAKLDSLTASLASATSSGYMSSADKIKLNAFSTSTATASTNGLMSTADKSKLDSIATSSIGKVYEGTTLRTGSFRIYKNATVASGVATFHLTADGNSGGTALFPNGVIQDSIDVEVNDASASYQMSYALSNGNKTITVTANKLTTANILTGILGQAQANGSVVRLVVEGY